MLASAWFTIITIMQKTKGDKRYMIVSKIQKIISNPYYLFVYLGNAGLLNWMGDNQYLRLRFRGKLNAKLDLKSPKSFNEKLQWLKIYYRRLVFNQMADKYEAKKYAAAIIGDEYIIPTFGVWEKFDDISFDELPERFVIKTTHDQGGVIICRDRTSFNMEAAREKISRHLKRKYYQYSREWSYKGISPRIIAEQLVGDGSQSIYDYKFMCFNGKVRCIFVLVGRNEPQGMRCFIFDENWGKLPCTRPEYVDANQRFNDNIQKPKNFETMCSLSERLAQDFPFLRVDWYEHEEKLYLGELTLYPSAGLRKFVPEEWDLIMGEWLILPERTNEETTR